MIGIRMSGIVMFTPFFGRRRRAAANQGGVWW